MNKPYLTYILPTKQRLEWIAESLSSLMYQTEPNIEIIVINDGSTDGTDELLNSDFVKKDERVKVITHEKSMGAGYSRNEGTKLAQADIVAQFDDDDISLADRTEKTLKWFKEHPRSELINFGYIRIGMLNEVKEQFPGEEFDHERFIEKGQPNYYSNPSAAYRKKSFLETDGYGHETKDMTDDYQFVQNWIKAGKKIDWSPDGPVVLHRVLKDSMMVSIRGWRTEWAA